MLQSSDPLARRDRSRSRPRLAAHRGASDTCPENTISAFREAVRLGVDGVEFDVQLSADGIPVVWHDDDLARIGRGGERPRDLVARELCTLDATVGLRVAPSGEPIPTLAEALEVLASGCELLVEIKVESGAEVGPWESRLLEATVRTLERHPSRQGASLLCFEPEILCRAAQVAPDLPRVLNLEGTVTSCGVELPWHFIDGVSMSIRAVTERCVERIRAARKALMVWTCNTEDEVEKALRIGADVVMTDRPAWVIERFPRSFLRSDAPRSSEPE